MRHVAMNITTGEVMETRRGNQLKRGVAHVERSNRKYYDAKGKWIFAHGTDPIPKLLAKYVRFAERAL